MKRKATPHPLLLAMTSLIFSLLLGSCTVYYNASDIKKTFSQSQREVNKALGKFAKDRREKRGIYNQLVGSIPDSSLAPYPGLSNELISMTRSFKQLKQTAKELEQMKASLSRLVKGRKKIESGSSLWNDFQIIKVEFDTQSGIFESQAETYNIASNNFIGLLNKHKISSINVVEVRQDIEKYFTELNESVQAISAELVKSQQNPKLDKTRLKQLEEMLTSVKTDQQILEALVQDFEEEVGDEPKVWSAPGMHSYSILTEMKVVGNRISNQGKTLNKLAKGL